MNEKPFPKRGMLEPGAIYRMPALPSGPKRELDPERLEVIRRGREKEIREYLKRRGAN